MFGIQNRTKIPHAAAKPLPFFRDFIFFNEQLFVFFSSGIPFLLKNSLFDVFSGIAFLLKNSLFAGRPDPGEKHPPADATNFFNF